MEQQETELWSGSPSQAVNINCFIFWGLIALLLRATPFVLIPLFLMLMIWLNVKNTRYELTNQRLRIRRGILSKQVDELELYRIKDYTVTQPLMLRLFSLGNLSLVTSDQSSSYVQIKAVKNVEQVKDIIRNNVEALRKEKGIRELDVR